MALLSLDRHDVLETIRQSNSLHEAFLRVAKLPAVGEYRTATNADRIRAMTDEELAEFMCHNVSNGTVNCSFCAAAEFCRMGHNGWLDWLKEEAKGDTDEDKA